MSPRSMASTWPSRPARSTASSARTAPGSRRRCACCARCSRRRADGPSSPASTSRRDPEQVRLRIGVALQDAALDPKQTGTELLRLQGRLYGLHARRSRPAGRRAGRADRHRRRARPPDRHLLRRHEAPARPRRRARPQPGGPVPRRADHRARPGQPGRGWEEVRRLNDELGMTIFLTTQYLEEADELADRVGIIDRGQLVAEGTPDELKRAVGDRRHRRPRRRRPSTRPAVRSPASTASSAVEVHGDELDRSPPPTVPAAISPVAVALERVRRARARAHAAHADARRRVPRAHRQPHRAPTHDPEEVTPHDHRHRPPTLRRRRAPIRRRGRPASSPTSSVDRRPGAPRASRREPRDGHPAARSSRCSSSS